MPDLQRQYRDIDQKAGEIWTAQRILQPLIRSRTGSKHTAAAFEVLAAAVQSVGRSPRPRYNDLWIAAQAIEHGYTLLTINGGDFAGLPGLRLITFSPETR